MKMTRVKSAIQKLAFPLLIVGLLWAGHARAIMLMEMSSA
jgi:hypothetical protein